MSSIAILDREAHWVCPNCTETKVTFGPTVRVLPGESVTEMHYCAGLNGLIAPMVPEGVRCKVTAENREDYSMDQILTTDQDGNPKMAVVITRDDGEDRAVLAPAASFSFAELMEALA